MGVDRGVAVMGIGISVATTVKSYRVLSACSLAILVAAGCTRSDDRYSQDASATYAFNCPSGVAESLFADLHRQFPDKDFKYVVHADNLGISRFETDIEMVSLSVWPDVTYLQVYELASDNDESVFQRPSREQQSRWLSLDDILRRHREALADAECRPK